VLSVNAVCNYSSTQRIFKHNLVARCGGTPRQRRPPSRATAPAGPPPSRGFLLGRQNVAGRRAYRRRGARLLPLLPHSACQTSGSSRLRFGTRLPIREQTASTPAGASAKNTPDVRSSRFEQQQRTGVLTRPVGRFPEVSNLTWPVQDDQGLAIIVSMTRTCRVR
jgi:hypothetical protein